MKYLKVIPGHREKLNLFFQVVFDFFPSAATVTHILSQISTESKGVPIKPMTSYPQVRTLNKQSPSKTQCIFKGHLKLPMPNSSKGKKNQKQLPPSNKTVGQNIAKKEISIKTNNYIAPERAFDSLGIGYFLSLENETTKEIDNLISQMNQKENKENSNSSLDQDKFLKEIDNLMPIKNSPMKFEKQNSETKADLKPKEEVQNLKLSLSSDSNKLSESPIKVNNQIITVESNNTLGKNENKIEAAKKCAMKEETKENKQEILDDYPDDFEKDESSKNSDIVIICNESKIEKSNISYNDNNHNSDSPDLNNKKHEEMISRYGYSMDFTKAGGGIDDIDLKLMCKCLSYAIKRHIVFSQGCTLIQELGEKVFKYQDNKMLDFSIHNEENKVKKNSNQEHEDLKETNLFTKKENANKLKELFEESFEFSINKKEIDNKTMHKNIDTELSYTESQLEDFFKSNIYKFNHINKIESLLEKNKQSIRNYYYNINNNMKNDNVIIVSSYNDLINVLNNNSFNNRKSYETEAKGHFDNSNILCNPNFELKKNKEANELKYSLESQVVEQKYSQLDENYKEYIKNKIVIFNENYDFDLDTFIPIKDIPDPDQKEICKFCKCVIRICKMEKEIPIICLIYIEKIMSKTGILINSLNWRRFTFVTLILASKVLLIRFGMMNLLRIFIFIKCFQKLASERLMN